MNRRLAHFLLIAAFAASAPLAADGVRDLAYTFRTAKDPAARIAAARGLAKHGARARGVVPILVEALGEDDRRVARWAAHALGHIGDASASAALIALIRRQSADASDHASREEAARALGRLGDRRAVSPLRSALRGPPALLAVPGALVGLQGRRCIGFLVEHAGPTRLPPVRLACVGALGDIGSREAGAPLVKLLADAPASLARGIIAALGRIGDPAALKALAAYAVSPGTAATEPVIDALRLIGRYADPAPAAQLASLASSPLAAVREALADALGRIGSAEGLETLARLAEDEHWAVRAKAILAIGVLDVPGVPALLATALKDRVAFVRADAARALGLVVQPGRLQPLLRATTDPDATVRRQAVQALERLGDPGGVPGLIDRLADDTEPRVRAAAARALGGRLGADRLLHLYRALGDRAAIVRMHAARALARIAPRPGIDPARLERDHAAEADALVKLWLQAAIVRADPTGRTTRTRALHRRLLGATRRPGEPGLVALQIVGLCRIPGAYALLDGVRAGSDLARADVAMDAMALTRDPRFAVALRAALRRATRTGELARQRRIIRAMGWLRHRAPTPDLATVLRPRETWPPDGWQQVELATDALEALRRIATPEAIDAILSARRHPSPVVGRALLLALRRLGGVALTHVDKQIEGTRDDATKTWLEDLRDRLAAGSGE